MSIGNFFKEVFCAPYSLPIGIINYKYATIDYCSKVTSLSLDEDETDNHDSLYKDKAEIEKQDIISSSQYAILNQSIQDILSETFNLNTQTVSSNLSANVSNMSLDENGGVITILPLSEDPDNEYLNYILDYTTEKLGEDGNIYLVKEFGCSPPNVDQVQEISIYTLDEINTEIFERIINEVQVSIENTLTETGSDIPSSTYTSTLTDNLIKNMIKQKINSMVTNKSTQTVNVDLDLEYIDRYGKCIYDFTDKGLLKQNTYKHECILKKDFTLEEMSEYGNIPNYINGVCHGSKNRLKQSLNIEIISKNIIDISIGVVLETVSDIETTNKVKIHRITNHRAIVLSLLFNVIFIYLLYKIFSVFLNRIN